MDLTISIFDFKRSDPLSMIKLIPKHFQGQDKNAIFKQLSALCVQYTTDKNVLSLTMAVTAQI